MSIRLLILFYLSILFNVQYLPAQAKLEKIKHIQDVFKTVNKTSNLKIVKLENEEFLENMTDGGAELTGFFKRDSLIKIKEWVGMSYGSIGIEYYFEKHNLVFAYVRESYFPYNDSSINQTKLILKFEGRYYYENKEMIAQKNSGSGMWGDSLDKLNPLLENSNRYSKLLISKLK